MSIIDRPPLGLKQPKAKRDPKRLARVAELPCVVCYFYGLPCSSPVQVHHCIHGRYSQARAPDSATIPLCEGHHQGEFDNTQLAVHRNKAEWELKFGPDTDFIEWTNKELEESE